MLRARHSVPLLLVVLAVGLISGSQRSPEGVLLASAVPPLPAIRHSSHIDPARPECPHDFDTIPLPIDGQKERAAVAPMVFVAGLSVPGPQSNVPEFNDCQRLIVNAGRGPFRYGPLMAVFASYRLDSLPITADTLRSNAQVFAAAEVLDYSNVTGYAPLAIGPLFNCLYVWGTIGSLQAKMVHVGRNESSCAESFTPSAVPGQTLAVREVAEPGFGKPGDYPPVARWDWDPAGKTQYIGLRCGTEWCEVGRGTTSMPTAPQFASSAPYGKPTASMGERRVVRVKGWYDQQYLSIFEGGVVHPTLLRGTIIPDPGLAAIAPQAHPGTWDTTSHVALDRPPAGRLVNELKYYREKFNFDPVAPHSPITAMNHILVCFGTASRCGLPALPTTSMRQSCDPSMIEPGSTKTGFWSKITTPTTRPAMYRCMTYYRHVGVSIPATARWRWLAADETTWRYCPSGCCEVNGN